MLTEQLRVPEPLTAASLAPGVGFLGVFYYFYFCLREGPAALSQPKRIKLPDQTPPVSISDFLGE